jgi:hypothetical protein
MSSDEDTSPDRQALLSSLKAGMVLALLSTDATGTRRQRRQP